VEDVSDELDHVARYALSLGLLIRPRTILVEGTTDAKLFQLAAQAERDSTGVDLLGSDLTVLPAGTGDLGGTRGVIRELVCLRGLARTCLLPNGRPRYRFLGLFDNDKAGKLAVRSARDFDNSILEYKDVLRLWPAMPIRVNLDPVAMRVVFERENNAYRGLDWEMEDLLSTELLEAFLAESPGAMIRTSSIGGKVHRDFSVDGKARLHRFVRDHAMRRDLIGVLGVLRAVRGYLGLV
jgi:hypothetical protein